MRISKGILYRKKFTDNSFFILYAAITTISKIFVCINKISEQPSSEQQI